MHAGINIAAAENAHEANEICEVEFYLDDDSQAAPMIELSVTGGDGDSLDGRLSLDEARKLVGCLMLAIDFGTAKQQQQESRRPNGYFPQPGMN